MAKVSKLHTKGVLKGIISVLEKEKDEFTRQINRIDMLSKYHLKKLKTLGIDYAEDPVSYPLPKLNQKDKKFLIDVAYKAVDMFYLKTDQLPKWKNKFLAMKNRVYVSFRVKGMTLGCMSYESENLDKTVYYATLKTLNDKRFGGLKKTQLKNLMITIYVVGKFKRFDENYEKGIHGVCVKSDKKSATFINSVAVTKNFDEKFLLKRLCEKAGLNPNDYNNPIISKYYFSMLHFGKTRFSDNVITFYRCNILAEEPIIEKVRESRDLSISWLKNNFKRGYFAYEYNPSIDKYIDDNNDVRQIMTSGSLARNIGNDKELLEVHKKNMKFIFSKWYKEKGKLGFIVYKKYSQLGSIAAALRLISGSPLYNQYKDIAKKLYNTICDMQNKDGSFEPIYGIEISKERKKTLLTFFSGEAILSLIEYYHRSKRKKVLKTAIKSQDYFLKKYVDEIDENYATAYVPWHTFCLNHLYKITKDKKYSNGVYILTDTILPLIHTKKTPCKDYYGRFIRPETKSSNSASEGIYTEGVAYAYEIAKLQKNKTKMKKYEKALMPALHNLINLQFKGPNMFYIKEPKKVEGMIRYKIGDNRFRVDCAQHAIDAFSKVIEIFDLK